MSRHTSLLFVTLSGLAAAGTGSCATGAREDDASTAPPIDAATADGFDLGRPDGAAKPDGALTADADVTDAPALDSPGPDAPTPLADAALTDGPLADAVPPDAMPPDACVPVVVNLLQNPGFDQGPAVAWAQSGQYDLIVTSAGLPNGFKPQAGTHAAWMGGYAFANDELLQTVIVPAKATALRFRGYRYVASLETGTMNDTLTIKLRTGGGALLEQIGSFTNLNTTTAWTTFEFSAASAHAGETIQIYLQAKTGADPLGNSNTNFFLDTFALEATTCP